MQLGSAACRQPWASRQPPPGPAAAANASHPPNCHHSTPAALRASSWLPRRPGKRGRVLTRAARARQPAPTSLVCPAASPRAGAQAVVVVAVVAHRLRQPGDDGHHQALNARGSPRPLIARVPPRCAVSPVSPRPARGGGASTRARQTAPACPSAARPGDGLPLLLLTTTLPAKHPARTPTRASCAPPPCPLAPAIGPPVLEFLEILVEWRAGLRKQPPADTGAIASPWPSSSTTPPPASPAPPPNERARPHVPPTASHQRPETTCVRPSRAVETAPSQCARIHITLPPCHACPLFLLPAQPRAPPLAAPLQTPGHRPPIAKQPPPRRCLRPLSEPLNKLNRASPGPPCLSVHRAPLFPLSQAKRRNHQGERHGPAPATSSDSWSGRLACRMRTRKPLALVPTFDGGGRHRSITTAFRAVGHTAGRSSRSCAQSGPTYSPRGEARGKDDG